MQTIITYHKIKIQIYTENCDVCNVIQKTIGVFINRRKVGTDFSAVTNLRGINVLVLDSTRADMGIRGECSQASWLTNHSVCVPKSTKMWPVSSLIGSIIKSVWRDSVKYTISQIIHLNSFWVMIPYNQWKKIDSLVPLLVYVNILSKKTVRFSL